MVMGQWGSKHVAVNVSRLYCDYYDELCAFVGLYCSHIFFLYIGWTINLIWVQARRFNYSTHGANDILLLTSCRLLNCELNLIRSSKPKPMWLQKLHIYKQIFYIETVVFTSHRNTEDIVEKREQLHEYFHINKSKICRIEKLLFSYKSLP